MSGNNVHAETVRIANCGGGSYSDAAGSEPIRCASLEKLIHCLNGRVLQPEVLDTLPPEQARANLAELVIINRHWGGRTALRKLLDQAIPVNESFTLLDVGAASGDMGTYIRELRPGARVVSLDYLPSHLETCPGERIAADAFSLPFAPGSFDYVFSSLFLHHFPNDGVAELFRAFGGIARRAVLTIDLLRSPIPYYFMASAGRMFGWDGVTIQDGMISVEAAFRPEELEALARKAGLAQPRWFTVWPGYRIGMWAGTNASAA